MLSLPLKYREGEMHASPGWGNTDLALPIKIFCLLTGAIKAVFRGHRDFFFLPKLCCDLLGWWHMWLQKLKEGSPENSRRKFPMFVKAGRQDGL